MQEYPGVQIPSYHKRGPASGANGEHDNHLPEHTNNAKLRLQSELCAYMTAGYDVTPYISCR